MGEHAAKRPKGCIRVCRASWERKRIGIAVFDLIELPVGKVGSRKQVPAVAVVGSGFLLQ